MSSISPPPPQTAADKTEGSNTIMSTSFALKFWSNKIIDVNMILSITLLSVKSCSLDFITQKICVEIGANLYDFSLFQTWISGILDNIKKFGYFFA